MLLSVSTGVYCNASWDGFRCWPPTPANTTVVQPCPLVFSEHQANLTQHFLSTYLNISCIMYLCTTAFDFYHNHNNELAQ